MPNALASSQTQISKTENGMVSITTVCPFCQKPHSVTMNADAWAKGFKAYQDGADIQYAFPFLSVVDRELLITGICDECWNSIFK